MIVAVVIISALAYTCLIVAACASLRDGKSEYPFTSVPERVTYNGHTYLCGDTDDGYQRIQLD